MVNSIFTRQQRFMHHDASFDRPTRDRRTHANDSTIARLKKLPLQLHLEMNKKIMDRNRARREKALVEDDISDVESLITIEDEEMDDICLDPDVFTATKPFLDAATIREMNRANKEDATTGKDLRPVPNNDDLELEPDIILVKHDATQPCPITFPKEMCFTVHHKHVFPLTFFTPKNLSFINANIHRFKCTRLIHEDKKHILNINDMEKRIKEAGTGPSKDEEMTNINWLRTYDLYYSFEASRYKGLEQSSRALFFQAHFSFFVNQEDSDKLFDIWKPYEAKLQQRHYETNMEFNEAKYGNTWSEIKAIAVSKSCPLMSKETGQQSSSSSSKNSYKPSTSMPSNQPFRSSNKDRDLAPRCIGCGQRGHKLGDKNTNHGKFPFAVYSGTELRAREGNWRICILFNCLGTCNKGCPRNTHVCSLCGGAHSCRDYHQSCVRTAIAETTIIPNHMSVAQHPEVVFEYLEEEKEACRMSGPFMQKEIERIVGGKFISSPIIVAKSTQGPGKPSKFRVCRHLSKGGKDEAGNQVPSINSFVEKEKFPMSFDSAPMVAEWVS